MTRGLLRSSGTLAISVLAVFLSPPTAHADTVVTNAPISFHLLDQFGDPKSCDYPKTRITVLVVADRKGCESIDGWIEPIKKQCGNRIDLLGLADLPDVPRFIRGMVVAKFKRRTAHAVGLDWNGEVSRALGAIKEEPNVFVMDMKGVQLLHVSGTVTDQTLSNVVHTIALAIPAP